MLPAAVIFGAFVGLGVAALTVDVGLLCSARSQIQRTVDSSALAGASGVMSMDSLARAEQFGITNEVANEALVAADFVIETGNWSGVTKTFTPTPESGDGDAYPNAVRVTGTRDHLDLIFAKSLGMQEASTTRFATALVGSGICAGLWGLENVTTNGGIITDSYDSTVGGYGPGNVNPNGDVCSCKDIVMHGSSSIRGDAMYGDGYAFLPSGHSYEVLGLIDDHACDYPYPTIDFAAAAASNDNANIPLTSDGKDPFKGKPYDLTLNGNDSLTLPPGTYYLDSVTINGSAYLEVTGATTIYVNGDAKFNGGGLVNSSQVASNLTVYAAGPDVLLSGNAVFYGALVAPEADVKVAGNFEGYGTIMGWLLTINGDVEFHVDEQLVTSLFGADPVAPVLVD
jgi:hypothetical protein